MHTSIIKEAELFKALADETRIRIICLMLGRELCVCDLTGVLHLPQPTISRHMTVLRSAGMVLDRRESKWVHYRPAEITPLVALNDYFLSLRDHDPYRTDFHRLIEYLKEKKC